MPENEITAGDRIVAWLADHPEEAQDIAFAAICGLYLGYDANTALPEGEGSYPRGSGSDYVDEVGLSLEAAGLMPLIQELQAEVEKDNHDD
jgi:hypothetical protein